MRLDSPVQKLSEASPWAKGAAVLAPPELCQARRFPYGPFQFRTQLPKGTNYTILATTDLKAWTSVGHGTATGEMFDFVDSEAFKHNHRFYRLKAAGGESLNVIGYVSLMLQPGFSMIAYPLEASQNTVAELFQGWPDGTTFNKFDARFFRLAENVMRNGQWINPNETLAPGEGAIFLNPTNESRPLNLVGNVMQGDLSFPVPSGFSIRSMQLPQRGNLKDLGFPLGNGDVIHLFDRDRQKYVLHPYENGEWVNGPPVVEVGESFWVAKAEAGNWSGSFSPAQ